MLKNIWKHTRLYGTEQGKVVVGSARKDAKQVNITIEPKHIKFAGLLFVLIIIGLYVGLMDNPAITSINSTIICEDGIEEQLYLEKTVFCGVAKEDLSTYELNMIDAAIKKQK